MCRGGYFVETFTLFFVLFVILKCYKIIKFVGGT